MTNGQRQAKTFLLQFHHRPFSLEDLEKALQMQGFSLVEYSRASNSGEVATILKALQLFDYAAAQSAFTYQDTNFRIVFLQENLSQQEKMILLSHELGHILCRHLNHTPVTAPGSGVLEEQEANDFAAALLAYNRTRRIRRKALYIGAAVLAALLVVAAVLFFRSRENAAASQETVYLTATGACYHKATCQYVVGKDNITATTVQQAEEDGYRPCSRCFGQEED